MEGPPSRWHPEIFALGSRTRRAMRVSLLLRQLLNVTSLVAGDHPLQCATRRCSHYIGRQFTTRWLQSRRLNPTAVVGLALEIRLQLNGVWLSLRTCSPRWLHRRMDSPRPLGQVTHLEEAITPPLPRHQDGRCSMFWNQWTQLHRSLHPHQDLPSMKASPPPSSLCDQRDPLWSWIVR